MSSDRRCALAVLVSMGCLVVGPLRAADDSAPQARELVVSLASDASPVEFRVDPGNYTLRVIDLVPTADYLVGATRTMVNPPQLRVMSQGEERGGMSDQELAACDALQQRAAALLATSTEQEVVAAVAAIRAVEPFCHDRSILDAVHGVMAHTEKLIGPFVVTGNDGWTIGVERPAGPRWTIAVLPPRSHWLVSYGFNGFPNKDQEYFTQTHASNGQTTFTIERKRDNAENYDVAPSIMATYLLKEWHPGDHGLVALGLSAGAGAEGDGVKPALVLGPTVELGDIVFLTAGALFHNQKRLLGELSPGQSVPAALTDKQLHGETYGWNWFFGFSFRFDREKKASGTTTKSTGTEKPAGDAGKGNDHQ